MAKASDDGSGDADTGAYPVFLDSNLGTHLAMVVSVHDTVRDVKGDVLLTSSGKVSFVSSWMTLDLYPQQTCTLPKANFVTGEDRIMIEHANYFPNIGKIFVNALKVKRKGCFYHLSDSMPVKSIFNGSMETLFLQFDACHQGECKENTYHLEPGASDLPSQVVTRGGPLAETSSILLDHPSKDVNNLDVPPVTQDGSRQRSVIFPQNSSDDKKKLKSSERSSTGLPEDGVLFPQNSSDNKQEPRKADSGELSIGHPEDDAILSLGTKKKKKTKKKESISYDQVDCDVPTRENVREEISEVALENRDGELRGETGAALASEHTNVSDPFVGFVMDKHGTSKVNSRDTTGYKEATRGRKPKGSKKQQAARLEGLNLPVVAECGNVMKDGINNNVDYVRGETFEVASENSHRNLRKEFDAALSSEQKDGADPFVDVDMRSPSIGNTEKTNASDHVEASRGRKLKRSKLTKGNTTLVSEVAPENDHVNSEKKFDAVLASKQTGAAGPFVDVKYKRVTSSMERRDASDHVEASGGRKSKRSKKQPAASVEGLNLPMVVESSNIKHRPILAHENFSHDIDDERTGIVEKESKALLQDEAPEPTLSETPNSKLESMDLGKRVLDCQDVVISSKLLQSNDIPVTGDSSDKRRKKSKKSGERTSEGSMKNDHVKLRGEFDAASAHERTDEPDINNMKRRDASGHVEASEGRKLKRSNKQPAAGVEGLNMPMVDSGNIKDSTIPEHENFCHKISDGDDESTGIIEKKKKAPLQDEGPKPTEAPISELKSVGLCKTGMDSKDVVISSKLLQSTRIPGNGDRGDKRRKKSKKSRGSDQPSSEGIEVANGIGGAIPSNVEEKHDTLFQNEEAKVLKVGTANTPLTDLDQEPDDAHQNEVKFVRSIQLKKIQEAEEGGDYKTKRKSKKTECSAKNFLDEMAEKQDVTAVDPVLSSDEKKGENIHSKAAKKAKLGKKGHTNQLAHSIPEAVKGIKVPCSTPGTNEPSEVREDIIVCNVDRPPHEADIRDDKGNNSKHFDPSQRQNEVAPIVDRGAEDIQIARSDKVLPFNRRASEHNVHSLGILPGLRKSFNSHDNQGLKENPRNDSFDAVELQAASKTKKGKPIPNRKISTTAGDLVKDPAFHYHEKSDSVPHQGTKPKTVDASGTNSPTHSSMVQVPLRSGDNAFEKESSVDWNASGSLRERPDFGVLNNIQSRKLTSQSKYSPVTKGKASSKKMGEVFNNSVPKKSLFAASGTIFKDSSSDNSEDEGRISNSDTSTKSPSDSSSSPSSDYLEGRNHSPYNDVYGGKRKDEGDNLTYSQSGGPKDMSLDMILRNSRSYRKAKLSASQSQPDDSESQPVEFVLDSLADP